MGFWIFQHSQKQDKQSKIYKPTKKYLKKKMLNMETMTQEDCNCNDAWDYNPNMLEILMHGHREWSCMSTLLHSHCTSVFDEILRWRGMTDITLKPWGEASKAWWNVLQHFHYISKELSLILSFSLNSLWHSSWVILATQGIRHLECLKLEAI